MPGPGEALSLFHLLLAGSTGTGSSPKSRAAQAQAAHPIPTLPESFPKDFKRLFSLLSIALPNNPCEEIATVQFTMSSMNYS